MAQAQTSNAVQEMADEPIALTPKGAGFDQADAAYTAYGVGDFGRASAAAAQAVRLEPGNRAYRALLIDALSARGDTQAADDVAAEVEQKWAPTVALAMQRGYFAMTLRQPALAAERFAWALQRVDLPAGKAREVRLAYSDALLQAGSPQAAANALEPIAAEPAFDVQSRLAIASATAGDEVAAIKAYERAASLAPTPRDRAFVLRSLIQSMVRHGDRAKAKALFEAELRGGAFRSDDPVDLGLAAVSVGDDRAAQDLFARDPSSSKLAGRTALDAAYSAKRAGREAAAIGYFERGLDGVAAGQLSLDPATDHAIRRDVAEISRVWGANGLVSYGTGGTTAAGGTLGARGRSVTQAGGELYRRLGGYRNGAPVEVFGRVFETLAAETGDRTGSATAQGWVGVRWKPFRETNLILETSRMIKLGSQARNDWMARAAYSAGQGLDLGPQVRSRPMWNLYGDVARIVDNGQTLGVVDARLGWARRVGTGVDGLVVAPFVGVNYAYDNSFARQSATGVGAGLIVRRWFRSTTYAAPRSYLEATLQARAKVAGDRRAEGVFASLAIAY
jgi:tetratricopeptide (TPR) repeat protein